MPKAIGKVTKVTTGRARRPKQSVTIRLSPEQIAALDAMGAEKNLDRTTLIQIAVGALLKQGVAAMLR